MPSYFRNFFGAQPQPTGSTKTHSRSRSSPQNQIYAPTPIAPSTTSSIPGHKRSTSFSAQTTVPSPLRYATYNAGIMRAQGHEQPRSVSDRTPMRRSSSQKPVESAKPYPLFTPSASYSNSSRSDSASSLQPSLHPAHSSCGSFQQPALRPVLKQRRSDSSGSASSQPPNFAPVRRIETLHMHPLLAYSRLHNPPISYNVTYTPSSRSVLDRLTHMSVPAHTLAQPATDPPTATSSRLVLRSEKIPWTVIVGPSGTSSSSPPRTRFYLGSSSSSSLSLPKKTNDFITNLDVLYAVHNNLLMRVTQKEWEALGHGSKAQRKATKAYERRCTKMGGGWEGGVRRVDWLGEKTKLVGVEVDRNAADGGGLLVFAKA